MALFWDIFDIDTKNEYVNIGKIIHIRFDAIYNIAWTAISIIIILIFMFLVIKLGNKLINKFVKRQIESQMRFSLDNKRAATIGAILKSILKYSVYFLGIAAIFNKITGGMSLTIAGIGSVAVGFGSQNIVKDVISGFFIVFEEQYSVGDSVTIDGKYSGTVESIGLRATQLKDVSGSTHIIPNGSIGVITNHSKDNMRVLVDIDIDYNANIDNAIEVINEACEEFMIDNEDIVEAPKAFGVTQLSDFGVTIRVVGKAKPSTQAKQEAILRKLIKDRLEENDIEIAHSKISFIKSQQV